MRSSLAAAGAGPRLPPLHLCSPAPSEDGDLRWGLPRDTEGPQFRARCQADCQKKKEFLRVRKGHTELFP